MQGFQTFEFTFGEVTKEVYKLGGDDKPAVLLLLELPGMTEHTVDFARRLHRDGYTVYLPLLFGTANSPFEPGKNVFRMCIQKEFNLLAHHKPSLITEWLRALSREMQAASGGPVGAIGMCFTGGFVLSLMIDESISAPVMSQPGYAGGMLTKKGKAALGLPKQEVADGVARAKRDNISVLGFRFTNDPICTKYRFDAVEEMLGEHFIRYEIDSSLFNKHKISPFAHAVHTIAYDDTPGHPTRLAYEKLLSFFGERLVANA